MAILDDFGWRPELAPFEYPSIDPYRERAFSAEHIKAIETHPYARAVNMMEIAEVANISIRELRELFGETDAQPILTFGSSEASSAYRADHINHYYSADVIEDVLQRAERFNLPEDHLTEQRVVDVLDITTEALRDISQELGMPESWYRVPRTGGKQRGYSKQQVAAILDFLRSRRHRLDE